MSPEAPGAADGTYARRFAGNAAWILIGQASAKVASFFFVIVVARGLGTVQYGNFNFATTFIPLFLTFGTWGVDVVIIRELSRDRGRLSELFASGFLGRVILGLFALLLAVVAAPYFVEGRQAYLSLGIIGAALYLDELSSFLGVVFKAFERMRFHALVLIVNRLLSMLFALLAVALGGDLVLVSVMYMAGSLGAFLFAWIALKRNFPPIRFGDFRKDIALGLLKRGLPIGVATVLGMAVFRIDAVMLQVIKGPVQVAMYGTAYRFLEAFIFIPWGLSTVALPRIARAGATGVSARTFDFVLMLILAAGLPLAVGTMFVSPWLVSTVFSARYLPGAAAVPWLTSGAVFYGVAHLSRVATVGLGRRSLITWIAAIALTFNVGLNLFAIPRFGFQGAAMVTCLTEALEAALLLGLFSRTSGELPSARAILAPAVAAILLGGALFASSAQDSRAILIGAPVYLVSLLILTRILTPEIAQRSLQLIRAR